jgi:sigma-B regulation protein RsbU (phosphoserine phosphatase)
MNVSGKKSILVIDDDVTIRKLIAHHLNLHDYKVHLASNTKEGFDELYNNHIDLVLCDVLMDKMDGFQFCQLVREKKVYRSIPFVFISAKNTMEDKSRALEVGGDDFITKPFNVEELILKIKALIRRSEINQIYGTRKNIEEIFSKRTPKVVIVDDDEASLKIYQTALNKAGIDCRAATNSIDGLNLARSFTPDLIISDLTMPDIDGTEFRDMLLQDSDLASIPFMFMSSQSTEQDILKGYERDITDYFVKSMGPNVFVAKVSSLIKSLTRERRKVVTDLHEASDSLRITVVPDGFPEFENFIFKYWHIPFTGIPGGDFIDHFLLDDDHIAIVLGDVMGKKWGAWYFAYAYAGYIRSAIHSIIEEGDISSPGKIISKVNKLVYQDSKVSEVFSTLSVVIIDKKNMTLIYSGAGDLPILYKNKSTGEVKRIDSKGLLLGFDKKAVFQDAVLKMSPGDTVVMTTDGIIECRDGNGNQYGVSRLLKAIRKKNFIESPLEVLKSELNDFNQVRFEDDVSVVIISASE